MADQKKWFKVWGSILIDPGLSRLSLADMGRWVRLGAYMTTSGERGKLTIIAPAPMLLLILEVESLADAKMALKRLPNVQINDVHNDNGDFIVIMRNWFKYQVDSTAYERVKRSRHKKRVEEKREDVTTTSPSTSTPALRASRLGGAVATRENSTAGGPDGNGNIRSKSIDQQAAERRRAQEAERIRRESSNQPGFSGPSSAGEILGRIRGVPDVQSET